jgi:deoxyribonuclease IV
MTKFRIGRHINISSGFITAPKYADSIGCKVFQVFLGNPRGLVSKPRDVDELVTFSEELNNYDLEMVVHGNYTINFCHPVKSKQFKRSLKSLINDLDAVGIIGPRCMGVIIHMGKNISANKLSDEEAMENYVVGLQKALDNTSDETTIILETGASQGTEIASRLTGLSKIYKALDKHQRKRIKFCIDTCHIWASGYDISTEKGVKQFFSKFDKLIGIENIACIHYNDSKTGLQSCVDRHADIGHGHIKDTGLKAVLKFAVKHKIPTILETPLDSINQKTNKKITFPQELEKIKSWMR